MLLGYKDPFLTPGRQRRDYITSKDNSSQYNILNKYSRPQFSGKQAEVEPILLHTENFASLRHNMHVHRYAYKIRTVSVEDACNVLLFMGKCYVPTSHAVLS